MKKNNISEVEFNIYEGALMERSDNLSLISSKEGIRRAFNENIILEAYPYETTYNGDLLFRFGDDCVGILPTEEYDFIFETTHAPKRFALCKPACFMVTEYSEKPDGTAEVILSRKAVHKEYFVQVLSTLTPDSIICAKVVAVKSKAAIFDLGYGYTAYLPVTEATTAFISGTDMMFRVGQSVLCKVIGISPDNRIFITHKSLIGTVCDNLASKGLECGSIVTGTIYKYIGDNAALISVAPGIIAKVKFSNINNLPPVGKAVRAHIASIDRLKDKVVTYFLALSSHMPDFTKFSYFLPEEAVNNADKAA